MKRLFFGVLVTFCASAFSVSFDLESSVLGVAPFVRNNASTFFGTYLARNVPFAPISLLKDALEQSINRHLIARDEAHITVITPPEYEAIKDKVSIDDIHAMVENTLQDISFEPICVGQGSVEISGNMESTYYVVVRSEGLLETRRQVAQLFYSRGGEGRVFDPEVFYPHITLGFTKRDLHLQDGVKKDQTSCIASLRLIEL